MEENYTQRASSPLSHKVPLSHGRGVLEVSSVPLGRARGEAGEWGEADSVWQIRPMSKAELAMAYAPNLTQQGAVKRLMEWIRHNPELAEALERTGYSKTQKLFTSLQVRTIVSYLGEP